jgi:hypothetical protein
MTTIAAVSIADAERALRDAEILANNGVLEKHRKYQSLYKSNDVFWGFGLEHEFYIETGQYDMIKTSDITIYNKPERYSVKYNTVYNTDLYEKAVCDIGQILPEMSIPILYNAYSWQKTDLSDNHITTYTKVPQKNPKFNGKTIHEYIIEKSEWWRNNYEKTYTYDGDTFEIMTQDFYKICLKNVIKEYQTLHTNFIHELRRINGFENARIMSKNYPFVKYKTNISNIAMFNNGTTHINITLPTKLNKDGKIESWQRFVEQHRSLARAIQWIEPLWIAVYGASDPLAASKYYGDNFSASSQRCAVSRYIGIGTYDTVNMPTGKILQLDVSFDDLSNTKYGWYDAFYRQCEGYQRLQKIGMDLNFNKHPNHGLELRFFEQLPVVAIREISTFLIYLADFTLTRPKGWIPIPQESNEWKHLVCKILQWGPNTVLTDEVISVYSRIFGIKTATVSPKELYAIIGDKIAKNKKGICVQHMLPEQWSAPSIKEVPIVEKPSNCKCM